MLYDDDNSGTIDPKEFENIMINYFFTEEFI